MENRKRNVHLHGMVTPDELAAIHERMAEVGISNAGAYVRKMALNGGARYTKSRRPVTLVYYEEFATKEEAMSREWAIKRLSRREKEKLIRKKEDCKQENRRESGGL